MAGSGVLDARTTHLLLRATFGLNNDLVAQVASTGVDAWLAAQLTPGTVSDTACASVLARYPRLGYSIATTHAKIESKEVNSWAVMQDVCEATLARALWSRRQLLEVMVDLWSNHFNVTCPSADVTDSRHRYDADVIRANALGRYSDMLHGVITHPSMLAYLGNRLSDKDNPNENLGREVLELHSVGVGNYTEQDVRNSTMILTGLSTDWQTGEFTYRSDWHYTGPVRVMGFQHPNADADGRAVVKAYLAYLATHPATARRVARKLAVRFVADDPPTSLIDALASIYLSQGTAIVPMLRHLFSSNEFAASAGAKTRTPYENLIASARGLELGPAASGVEVIANMYWAASDIGQVPLGWGQPDGYPDVAAAWASSSVALARWNMNTSLAGDWWPKGWTRPDLKTLLPSPLPATHGALIDAVAARILHRTITTAERSAICTFFEATPSTPFTAESNAYKWRLDQVFALVLDTATQARR